MIELDAEKTAKRVAENVGVENLTRVLLRMQLEVDRPFGGMSDEEVVERERGILSKADRRYLLGETEYKHDQTVTNRKRNIRNRMLNSLQDYLLLLWLMPKEEREKLVKSVDTEDLESYVEANIGFLFKLVESDVESFERLIEGGLRRSFLLTEDDNFNLPNNISRISADIDIKRSQSVEKIKSKLDRGVPLTDSEIGTLVRAGMIGPEEIKEIQRTMGHIEEFRE